MAAQNRMMRFPGTAAMLALMLLTCCASPKDSAFFNRGQPESLLDVSSEVVNLRVDSASKLLELSNWIAKDQPTRAELYCRASEPHCIKARRLLELSKVPVSVIASGDNSVALIYERILARDCNQHFTDNSHDMYNAPYPASGCSIAANMVQQVADKKQFVNPSISGEPDAVGAVDAYNRAYAPNTEAKKDYTVGDSLASKAKTSGD